RLLRWRAASLDAPLRPGPSYVASPGTCTSALMPETEDPEARQDHPHPHKKEEAMFPIIRSRELGRRPRGRRVGPWLALAAPALPPVVLAVIAVSSVSLSPGSLAPIFGTSATGT